MIHGDVLFPWWRARYLAEIGARHVEAPTEVLGDPQRDVLDWGKLTCFRREPEAAENALGMPFADILSRSRASRAVDAPPGARKPAWADTAEEWVALAGHYELPIETLDLLELVRPLLTGAFASLDLRIQEMEKDFSSDLTCAVEHVVHAGLQSLPLDSVTQAVSRVAVLEMHLARHEGRLAQEGGAERFHEFVTMVKTPRIQGELWAKYPVMVRFLVTRLSLWIEMVAEFIGGLAQDYDELCAAGLLRPAEPLRATFATGDAHNQGRSVILLRHDDGSGVVYKPRPASIDAAFSQLVSFINELDGRAQLHLPRVVMRGDYSWHEFIRSSEAPDTQAKKDLAYRLGVLNALFFTLSGNDFHHENVVLDGAVPVPIDLETACHPEQRSAAESASDYYDFSSRSVRESVAMIGILPGKILSQDDDETVAADISVIGFRPGQRSIMKMPMVQSYGTDEMRFEPERPQASEETESYVPHDVITRGDEFLLGFETTVQHLLDHREQLLDEHGVLAGFKDAHMRYIARPTMVYGKVLMESLHPDFLTFGPRREIVLAKLCSGFDGRPECRRAEKASLLIGDIPYFARRGSELSWLDRGDAPTLFDRLLSNVSRRLTPNRIAYEVDVARMSFAAAKSPVSPTYRVEPPHGAADGRTVVRRIVDDIARSALIGEEDSHVALTTVMPVGPEHWIPKGAGMDVYSGLTGIYLALRPLVAPGSSEDAFVRRLRASVLQRRVVAEEVLRKPKELADVLGTGAYSELGGYLLALGEMCQTASSAERPGIEADVEYALRANQALALASKANDIISGIAGLILVILTLPVGVAEAERRVALRVLADELRARADQTDRGLAWLDPETGQHLLGFSHGAAGIGVALLAAGDHLRDERISAAGRDALRFDDSFMDPETGDWPDLREETHDGDRMSMRAWCHGSPGALLARAMAWPYLDEDGRAKVREQVRTALPGLMDSVAPANIGEGNVSLCHGTVGNLVILDYLRRRGLVDSGVEAVVRSGLARITEKLATDGWAFGALPGAFVPDLMMGLSGTAWGISWLAGEASGGLNLMAIAPERDEAQTQREGEALCLTP